MVFIAIGRMYTNTLLCFPFSYASAIYCFNLIFLLVIQIVMFQELISVSTNHPPVEANGDSAPDAANNTDAVVDERVCRGPGPHLHHTGSPGTGTGWRAQSQVRLV